MLLQAYVLLKSMFYVLKKARQEQREKEKLNYKH